MLNSDVDVSDWFLLHAAEHLNKIAIGMWLISRFFRILLLKFLNIKKVLFYLADNSV